MHPKTVFILLAVAFSAWTSVACPSSWFAKLSNASSPAEGFLLTGGATKANPDEGSSLFRLTNPGLAPLGEGSKDTDSWDHFMPVLEIENTGPAEGTGWLYVDCLIGRTREKSVTFGFRRVYLGKGASRRVELPTVAVRDLGRIDSLGRPEHPAEDKTAEESANAERQLRCRGPTGEYTVWLVWRDFEAVIGSVTIETEYEPASAEEL
eukprot:TRINITY_DN19329_c0_g1_i1.p1 TRINITY_DN19329_c0_g1~~TRINITY_DN19329_c0_g1_i1.p1  ORF type:complete len:208 (-),score=23.21 TRINITY_DN19329_c0_g1_i1:14-637(-)